MEVSKVGKTVHHAKVHVWSREQQAEYIIGWIEITAEGIEEIMKEK